MTPDLLHKLLFAQLASGREITISVKGISMNPTLWEGDVITVRKAESYEIGDILVYPYKGELLVHRLLKIDGGRFFCKGDNALRLEDLPPEGVGGKVVLCNADKMPPPPPWLVPLSYQINRLFRACGYNQEKTKRSDLYRFYHNILWNLEDFTMTYKKNDAMDYIPADETSLAVFDPESGDTHFFDETATDILNCLDTPCDLDTLVAKLCEIYDAPADVIRNDVKEFMAEMLAKKVIVIQ